MKRRILTLDPPAGRWQLETIQVETADKDPREDYFVLSGEALCQYLLRRDKSALIIARGPMPFLSGNKATVGYISPLTRLPHYSFVGGRGAAQLLNLGLDAICFRAAREPAGRLESSPPYVVVRGRAPDIRVGFKPADELPRGQRTAYYWLVENELGGEALSGSVLCVGEGAYLGYGSANLAAEAIYHAGRGGAGSVFVRYAAAMVLRGEPLNAAEFFREDVSTFARNPNEAISSLLERHCRRLSSVTGGTISKLLATGADPDGQNTLPAWNAQRLGYQLADLGSSKILKATRQGQAGCHWCQVDCRHWHWVPAEYAPGRRDRFLDDFEPTYALFAMLGLSSADDTLPGRLSLLDDVNRRLLLPIEQLGCDALDIGLGLSALFEGLERGHIPARDAPGHLSEEGSLEAAVRAVEVLRSGEADEYPALRAVGEGPQALADLYPSMKNVVFTGGRGTLGNAGHCNSLWTFLMPFSRFFGHYVGQYYKVEEDLPPPGSDERAYEACFERVVGLLLQREFYWILANTLSQCAFTFVIFSEDGRGEQLSGDDRLVRILRNYGIETTSSDLKWHAQAFWAQSVQFKLELGWVPPTADEFPGRVYEALSLALDRTPEELRSLMDRLIAEWKRQAKEVLAKFGYEAPW